MVEFSERGSELAELQRRRRWAPIAPQFVDFAMMTLVELTAEGLSAERRRKPVSSEVDEMWRRMDEKFGSLPVFDLACDAWNACVRDALDPSAGEADGLMREARDVGLEEAGLALLEAFVKRKREVFAEDLREVVEFSIDHDAPAAAREGGAPRRKSPGFTIDVRPAEGLEALPAGHRALRPMLHPSLAEALEVAAMSDHGLVLATHASQPADRHGFALESWAKQPLAWRAPELDELATGTVAAPSGAVLDRERPPELDPLFEALERGVLEAVMLSEGPPTDQAVLTTLGLVRRRAAGRSHGPLFDLLWRRAALQLALNEYSRSELEAVLLSLERNVRAHRNGPGSRNYFDALTLELLTGPRSEEALSVALETLPAEFVRAARRVAARTKSSGW